VPWRMNSSARTNPRNGICLNALHDRAFDRGFISFDEDLKLIYSPKCIERRQGKDGRARRQFADTAKSFSTRPYISGVSQNHIVQADLTFGAG
jgi:hypothetical protein